MDVKLLSVNEHVAGDVGPPGPPGNHAIYMRVFFVTSNTRSRCTVLDQSSRSSVSVYAPVTQQTTAYFRTCLCLLTYIIHVASDFGQLPQFKQKDVCTDHTVRWFGNNRLRIVMSDNACMCETKT